MCEKVSECVRMCESESSTKIIPNIQYTVERRRAYCSIFFLAIFAIRVAAEVEIDLGFRWTFE